MTYKLYFNKAIKKPTGTFLKLIDAKLFQKDCTS